MPAGIISDDSLQEISTRFFAEHPDVYDQLVLWPALGIIVPQAFNLPIANDVRGIGYANVVTPELFGRPEFGSERLRSLTMMPSGWKNFANPIGMSPGIETGGRESLLGILAQEVAHQWAARVQYIDGSGLRSLGLLGRGANHWSFLLDTGGSPLGGSIWTAIGGGAYLNLAPAEIRYASLDLYLMGGLPPEAVPPMRILHPADERECGVLAPDGSVDTTGVSGVASACQYFWGDQPQTPIDAPTVETVTIEQVIAAEGPRMPPASAVPPVIRQAWIFVVPEGDAPDPERLAILEDIRVRWGDRFRIATSDHLEVRTDLQAP